MVRAISLSRRRRPKPRTNISTRRTMTIKLPPKETAKPDHKWVRKVTIDVTQNTDKLYMEIVQVPIIAIPKKKREPTKKITVTPPSSSNDNKQDVNEDGEPKRL